MSTKTTVKEICPSISQKWLAEGALLVDVREQEEVNQLAFDVPGMLHLPLSEFEERFNEIPQNRQVVVACRSGARSLRATRFLLNHGYDSGRVVNMQHGILRWSEKGFPLKGSPAPTDGGDCC